ncbi:MAG: hypothetical protein DRN00_00665 [Thermoplasmata archaeon]|nr:MAG: hypothetical protein DRN00_00665 [Thermoplasmata archaeon]
MIYDYGICSWGIAPADFNNDGWIDFVVAVNYSLYLKLNNHAPDCFDHCSGIYIGEIPYLPFVIGPKPPSAAIAPIDYNNDGKMDFLCGSFDALYLFMNQGNCTFKKFFVCEFEGVPAEEKGSIKFWQRMSGCYRESLDHSALSVLDFNGDGYQDIVSGGIQGYLRLFINNKAFITLTNPEWGRIYIFGEKGDWLVHPICKTLMWNVTLVIGNITVRAEGLEPLDRVEFYLDGRLVKVDNSPPYEWEWGVERSLFKKHVIDAVAYRLNGEYGGKYSIKVWKIL